MVAACAPVPVRESSSGSPNACNYPKDLKSAEPSHLLPRYWWRSERKPPLDAG
jgi:hypothetical protein